MNYCRQFRDEELDRSLSRPDIDLLFGTGGALSGVMYCTHSVCTTIKKAFLS